MKYGGKGPQSAMHEECHKSGQGCRVDGSPLLSETGEWVLLLLGRYMLCVS